MADRDTDPGIDPRLLDAWPAMAPPEGFAERALAAAERRIVVRPTPASFRRRALAVAVSLAAAAAFALAFALRRDSAATSGSRAPTVREELVLGERGVAVVEAASELRWNLDGAGARVEQLGGNVFYRVEPGGPFRVQTPAGWVEVTGTCFRVEVQPMGGWKDRIVGAAAGAAVGVTVVSVLEGKVLVGNEKGRTEIAAGETARIAPGEAPRKDASSAASADGAFRSPPAADATPEQLRARDREQREAIVRLEEKVRSLQLRASASATPVAGAPPKEKFHDFTQEELVALATQCELRYDVPAYALEHDPEPLPPEKARELGVTESEREALNRILAEGDDELVDALRKLYVEATGDTAGARTLSPRNLQHEVFSKSTPDQMSDALQQLARERAGLATPPEDVAARTPVERLLRLLRASGDRLEAELARSTGADRARELRRQGLGFGRRAQAQCPGETP